MGSLVGDGFHIRWSGEKAADAQVVGEMLTNLDGLFKAVAESMGEDPDSVSLDISGLHIICDGCETTRPDEHRAWVKRDGLDFCPDCQADKEADAERAGR